MRDNILVGGLPESRKINAIYLGKLAEYGQMGKNVWIDTEGAHAIYVMGKRRSGKTYTLGALAEGLVSKKWVRQGEQSPAVLILDTMNVFITMPYPVQEIFGEDDMQVKEILKWGLEKESFNVVLFYPKGTKAPDEGSTQELAIKPSDLSAEDWAGLFEVDTFTDPIGQLISELYEKVAIEGYKVANGKMIPANEVYSINDMLRCLDKDETIQRYEPKTIEAVRRRFKAIRRLPVFSEEGVDVKKFFVPGQISVLLLGDVDYAIRGLLIGVLVKKIMKLRSLSNRYERLMEVHFSKHENLSRTDPKKAEVEKQKAQKYLELAKEGIPRGWIIIDEAHNYIPSKGIIASREPLRKYVNEGRNLGLSIVVATQQPSGLDSSIRRNADILIIHPMSMREDIQVAEGMINTYVPDSVVIDGKEKIATRTFEQLVRSLDLGYAVISNDRANRIYVAKVRPRITVHGGMEY